MRWLPSHTAFHPVQTDTDLPCHHATLSLSREDTLTRKKYCFQALPFWQFHILFTLFSKCFSSFPHGTCSLSVSRRYLALDGIYHPLRAAFPNNPTLWECVTLERQNQTNNTGFSPSVMLCSKRLVSGRLHKHTSRNYNSHGLAPWDFKFELFPLHSPLLGESWLVSFPPLIDMLKFSGSSCLIWD